MRQVVPRVLALAILAVTPPPSASAQAQTVPEGSLREAADSQVALARCAMSVDDFGAAVRAADSALVLGRDRSAAQLVYGQAYLSAARANPSLRALGKVKAGRAAVEHAIELDPDNLEARHTLLQFLLQAPGFIGGSRDGALAQAVEIGRRDRVRGLLARLEVAEAGGKHKELSAVFDEAIPLMGGPEDPGAMLIGSYLVAAADLPAKKLRETLTERVYAAHRDHPVAAYHRARLWIIQGKEPAEAERLLLAYLSGPELRSGVSSRAGAHWRLGQLYDRLDREGDARERFRLAAGLDSRLKPGNRLPPRLESEI